MLRDFESAAPRLKAVGPISPAKPYQWRDPASLPRRRWIYGSQLLRGSLSVVVAPGATGKTAMMTGTALALATGRELLRRPVIGGPKRVWLWNLEDSTEELTRQVQASAMHWQISEADLGGRLFLNSALDGDTLKIAKEDREGVKVLAPVIEALVAELQTRQIDVLVVDPFVSSHDVNENSNGAIDAVAKQWAMVAVQADCSIVLVHHVSKAGSAEVTANSARGAVALTNAARSVVTLNRMTEEEAEKLGVEGKAHRKFFRAYDDKNNRAPAADESDWFELVSVYLGNGPMGGDSMPVVVPWSPPDPFADMTVDDLKAVQLAISQGDWREHFSCKDWAGVAVAETLGLDLGKASDKSKVKRLLATWIKNGALKVENRPNRHRENKAFIVVGEYAE
jgi:hypothetical protein